MAAESDALLKTFLTDRDTPCPVCGYNLRDLQNDLCPECGTRLRLQVGAIEPRQTACIVGLVGLSAGAGFSTLLIVFVMLVVGFHRHEDLPEGFWGYIVLPSLVEGALIYLWLRNWRRIRRLRGAGSALLAGACWVLAMLNVILVSAHIR